MEVYIVCDDTINRVVTWLAAKEQIPERNMLIGTGSIAGTHAEFVAQLGIAMLELNCAAFEHAYGPGTASEFRPLDFEFFAELASDALVFKSLRAG
jgi:hypothetical protein